jgi:hypothetical protein
VEIFQICLWLGIKPILSGDNPMSRTFFNIRSALAAVLGSVIVFVSPAAADSSLQFGSWSLHSDLGYGEWVVLDDRSGDFANTDPTSVFIVSSFGQVVNMFNDSGYETYTTNINLAAGDHPYADIQGELRYRPPYEGYYKNIVDCINVTGSLTYYFSVNKIYNWSPDMEVPMLAPAGVSAEASGVVTAKAEEFIYRAGDSNPVATLSATATATSGKSAYNENLAFWVDFGVVNSAYINVEAHAPDWREGPAYSYRESFTVVADPAIVIDPSATLDVNGTTYHYTDLYSLSFSPGFIAPIPIPGTIDWKGGTISDHTNWNVAANWNPDSAVPNGPGTKVRFGNKLAPDNMVDLISQGQTVGTITFSAYASTTIQSSGGFALTLDNNGSVSTIDVAGSHTISAPVVLNNDAIISGTGTLNLSGGITGSHDLEVDINLTATSIQVDTLTIGSGATVTIQAIPGGPLAMDDNLSSVPEPSTLVLLGIGAIGLLAYGWRKRRAT